MSGWCGSRLNRKVVDFIHAPSLIQPDCICSFVQQRLSHRNLGEACRLGKVNISCRRSINEQIRLLVPIWRIVADLDLIQTSTRRRYGYCQRITVIIKAVHVSGTRIPRCSCRHTGTRQSTFLCFIDPGILC
ncbi:hypothetical protein D3C72_1245560 [compost metagenome]